MLSAQMIVRAWTDEAYHTELTAQGLRIPPRPNDVAEEQLDLLKQDQEIVKIAQDCVLS